ncbi:hypothetical protein CCR75_006326 [Bremia lactucae]|uniref:Uncharacterized protein n=1 Tax=Bremia lactucae TaxID=4779 RepID=A0A976FQK8_BRELC|nr:hypothetical protein CCR75_006326 [Bremia lactucae]
MNPTRHLHAVFDPDGHKLVELPNGGRVAIPYDPLDEAERFAAEAARHIAPPDELRCRYKSTRCINLRAKKRRGELHNLCQLHRERANQNQRNSEQRKRHCRQPIQGIIQRKSERKQHHVNDHNSSKRTICSQMYIPEPFRTADGSSFEPTFEELTETALLLSFSDRE